MKNCPIGTELKHLNVLQGGKIPLVKVDHEIENLDPRYSLPEIDILCRNCRCNLGDILHICPKQLVTKCRDCGMVCVIDTQIEKSF